MRSRAIAGLAWSLAAFSIAGLGLGALLLIFGSPSDTTAPRPVALGLVVLPLASVFPIVGGLIASRLPRNPIGWLLLSFGVSIACQTFAAAYADHAYAHHEGHLPGDTFAAWLSDEIGNITFVAWIVLLPLLFPTGRLTARLDRVIAMLAVVVFAGLALTSGLRQATIGSSSWHLENPIGVLSPAIANAFNASGAVLVLLTAIAVARRYRRARGDERLQLKWFCTSVAVMIGGALTAFVLGNLLGLRHASDIAWFVAIFGLVSIPITTGIAILRYRLYEIDLIIRRTLLYGALTACVVAGYVGVLALAGAVFARQGGLAAAVVATAVVAILFEPVRIRVQRGVNRLLYGERDDPYAVVSGLAQRLENDISSPGAALPRVVQTVAYALRLPYAAIELDQSRGSRTVAVHGTPVPDPITLPLEYRGKPLGRLLVAPRTGEDDLTEADLRLLSDLSAQAGAAVHAANLASDLQEARERLVTAREEERRRLRHDLHDGLGPTLATMTLELDAARASLPDDPDRAHEQLSELRHAARGAIADIRAVIDGLRPPNLDEVGLTEAISRLGLVVHASGDLGSLPAAVEAAVYRIAQETTGARSVHLSRNGTLDLELTATGAPDTRGALVRERAEELGGTYVVDRLARGGYRVRASLPLESGS